MSDGRGSTRTSFMGVRSGSSLAPSGIAVCKASKRGPSKMGSTPKHSCRERQDRNGPTPQLALGQPGVALSHRRRYQDSSATRERMLASAQRSSSSVSGIRR